MEVAASLMLGMAKLEGEISREQKNEILEMFSNEFSLEPNKAKDLFSSTSYLLQSENNFIKNIGKILSPSKDKFSSEQAESTISLITRIAHIDSEISPIQETLLKSVKQTFKPILSDHEKWSE